LKKSSNHANPKAPSGTKPGGASSLLMAKIFGRADSPTSVQQSIPYRDMFRDGVCRVNDRLYTKTIAYEDITYHLAQNEDKTHIFENYCDYLNYFDSSISVQLSFTNRYGNMDEIRNSIQIPVRGDENDPLCEELGSFIQSQQAKGTSGIIKTKYVTFGIEADNLRVAKLRLERVETDILNNFKTLGVAARSLSGSERLEVLHNQLHPDGTTKFGFNWNDIAKTGLSTKDYIAPTSFEFRDGRIFRMGTHYGAVSYIQILAPELTDRMLADFLDRDTAVTVNLHIQSIDQSEAIKTIKRKLSDLEK